MFEEKIRFTPQGAADSSEFVLDGLAHVFLLGSILAGGSATLLASDVPSSEAAAKAALISGPHPEYPYAARRARVTGIGAVMLHIDRKTGLVTRAEMAPSTGHAILDRAALSAFQRWRFKPGTVSAVRTPIAFSMPVTIYPNRWYPFEGVVLAVNARAGIITVKGTTGTDRIVLTNQTKIEKSGQLVAVDAIAPGDKIRGRVVVRPPEFKAMAQSLTVSGPTHRR